MAFAMEQPQDGLNRPPATLTRRAVGGASACARATDCSAAPSKALEGLRKERNKRAAKARLRDAALEDHLQADAEQE